MSLRVSYGPDNDLKGKGTVGPVGWRIWSTLEKGAKEGQRWSRKESAQRCCLRGVQRSSVLETALTTSKQ